MTPQFRASLAARPILEALEDRTLLSSFHVVPLSQAIDDQTSFHTLVAALGVATHPGDTVTIEPGVVADPGQIQINSNAITIQGDLSAPTAILPQYNLVLNASNISISHQNLGTVAINPDCSGNSIVRSLVDDITITGGSTGAGDNVIDHDTISGSVVMSGVIGTPQIGNSISNNTFISATPNSLNAIISIQDNNCVLIQNNQINGQAATAQDGISITRGLNEDLSDNTISLAGTDLTSHGIILQNAGGGPLMTATVANNTINTGQGVGLFLNAFNDVNLQAQVQGNDFHGNAIGVDYVGSGGLIIGSDLGGGSNSLGSSLGGNDFHGFSGASETGAAIRLSGAGTGASLHAEFNIFANPNNPSSAVTANGPDTVDLNHTLSQSLAFVQSLYNELLGRTGTTSEIDGWATLLSSSPNGQATVANGILHSSAALARIVDQYYNQFLDRSADSGGQAFWVSQLQQGASLESVQAGFLSSQEFLAANGGDYVEQLFGTFLGRSSSQAELSYWYARLQQPNGTAATAQGFTNSTENRGHFVETTFLTLLHRTAAAPEITYFVNQPSGLLGIELDILSSGEFFSNG